MRFENGTPLLFEQTLGKGKLLTFTSPLDRHGTTWPSIRCSCASWPRPRPTWPAPGPMPATATVGTAIECRPARRGGGQVFDPAGGAP